MLSQAQTGVSLGIDDTFRVVIRIGGEEVRLEEKFARDLAGRITDLSEAAAHRWGSWASRECVASQNPYRVE